MTIIKLNLKRVFFIILLTTLIFSGIPYLSYFGYQFYKHVKLKNKNHKIVGIFQTGSRKNALPSEYLAELLGLSFDKSVNFFDFDENLAKKKLLESPFICYANVQKIKPNAIYIDYEIRKPFAKLADYENIAIDDMGYLFPCQPIFSNQDLPEIKLGLPRFLEGEDEQKREGGRWVLPVSCEHYFLALKVFKLFQEKQFVNQFKVRKVDVSNAFAPSFGRREIIIELEEYLEIIQEGLTAKYIFPKYLRLNEKEYEKQLANFLSLSQKMRNDYRRQINLTKDTPKTVLCKAKLLDFRIPQLAFIKEDE
jgi:hypothetical protein